MSDPRDDRPIRSVNPATDEVLRRYHPFDQEQIDRRLAAAAEAQHAWAMRAVSERAAALRQLADRLRSERKQLSVLMAEEMGKPLSQGGAEVDKCAWVCEHFAEHGPEQLRDVHLESGYARSYARFAPLGLILAIMPWNYPLWQVFRQAAPSLLAGNAIVLKHSRKVSGCAMAIESLFTRTPGLGDVLVTLLVPGSEMPELIREPRVAGVALTGSLAAGRSAAEHAAAGPKKLVLELGGSDPYIVLADADLELAARKCAESRMQNAGQSCIAAKRMIVVEHVYDEFVERLVAEMGAIEPGDPLDNDTKLGPLAGRDVRDRVHEQVQQTVEQGARLALGGEPPAGPGAFYPPTVLADVRQSMRAASEEVFGPVAAVMRASDSADAVRIANDSAFGLGGGIFSRDRVFAEFVARERLQTGMAAVNDYVRSDPRLPFGGVKESGYGREIGPYGAREFTNIKTVMSG